MESDKARIAALEALVMALLWERVDSAPDPTATLKTFRGLLDDTTSTVPLNQIEAARRLSDDVLKTVAGIISHSAAG